MEGTYISADGTVFPCCWLGNHPWSREYKEFHGDKIESLNVLVHELTTIIQSKEFLKVEDSWEAQPFAGCRHFCSGPIPQTTDGMDGTNEVVRLSVEAAANEYKRQSEK